MFDIVLLGFEQIRGVVVDGDRGDLVADTVEFAAAFAGVVLAGNFLDHVEAVGHLAEDRMAVVEERSGGGGDEELRTVGSRSGIGHRENPGRTVAQFRVEFVRELVARAATAAFGRIAALEHESLDHAVERDVVVVTATREIEEIRASERSLGRIHRGVDVASSRVEGDFDVRHGR